MNNDGTFRIVNCKSMYNLATSSLSGVGTYKVSAVINGVEASNPAVFDLKRTCLMRSASSNRLLL